MKSLADLIELALAAALRGLPAAKHEAFPPSEGFLLGREVPSGREVLLRESELRRHAYLIGATGSGKTNLLLRLIDEEMRLGRTVVVLDLRGDLADRVLARRGQASATAIDLRRDDAPGFNPLAGSGDPHTRAAGLLGTIRAQSDSWGVQLDETLRNALVALAFAGLSLGDLEPLLEEGDFRESALERCPDETVLRFFARYDSLSDERRRTWSLPVLNKVTPLLGAPQIRKMLSARSGGIDWRTLLDRPGSLILVALAVHRFHAASRLMGGLMVDSIERAVTARADAPESSRNPCTLFVDEFETMACPAFASIVAEGRRFGLSLVLSHQNLSQMENSLRQTVRNNAAVQLLFQTGAGDAGELAQDVAGLGGREQVKAILTSQKVGEALLVRRGSPTLRVATEHSPDPEPASAPAKGSETLEAPAETKPAKTRPNTKEARHDKPPLGLG